MWRERASSLWICLLMLVEATGVETALFGPSSLRFEQTQLRLLSYLGSEVVITALRRLVGAHEGPSTDNAGEANATEFGGGGGGGGGGGRGGGGGGGGGSGPLSALAASTKEHNSFREGEGEGEIEGEGEGDSSDGTAAVLSILNTVSLLHECAQREVR